jgi:aminobenzoyl-glutamate utilization protein B
VATNGMSIGRKAVIQAAKVLAATGIDMLTEPDLFKAVRDEFDKRIAGKPYKSLNDLEAPPEGALDAQERHHYECCIHTAMEHFGIKENAS